MSELRRYTFKLYPKPDQDAFLQEQRKMMADLWNALLQQRQLAAEGVYRPLIDCFSRPAFVQGETHEQRKQRLIAERAAQRERQRLARVNKTAIPISARGKHVEGRISQSWEITQVLAAQPQWRALSTWTPRAMADHLHRAFEAFFRRAKEGAGAQSGYPQFRRRERATTIPHRCLSGCTLSPRPREGFDGPPDVASARSWGLTLKGVPGVIRVRGEFPAAPLNYSDANVIWRDEAWWLSICVEMVPRRTAGTEKLTVRLDLIDEFARVERAEGQRLACEESISALAQSPNHLNTLVGGSRTDGNAGSDERAGDCALHTHVSETRTYGNAGSDERAPRRSSLDAVQELETRTDEDAGSDERAGDGNWRISASQKPRTDEDAGSDERVRWLLADDVSLLARTDVGGSCTDGNAGSGERVAGARRPASAACRACTDDDAGSDERETFLHGAGFSARTDENAGSDERGQGHLSQEASLARIDGNANDLDEFARVERAEGQRLACAESTIALAQSPNHLNTLVGGSCTDENAGSGERDRFLKVTKLERTLPCTDENAGSGERDCVTDVCCPLPVACTDGNAGSGERVDRVQHRSAGFNPRTDGNAGSDERDRVPPQRGRQTRTDEDAGSDERARTSRHRSSCTDGNAGSGERVTRRLSFDRDERATIGTVISADENAGSGELVHVGRDEHDRHRHARPDGNANDLDEFARVERAEGRRSACAESTSALAQSPNRLNTLVGGSCTDGNSGSDERVGTGNHRVDLRLDPCTDGNAGSGERAKWIAVGSCTDDDAGSDERASESMPPADGNAGSGERVMVSADENAGSDERGRRGEPISGPGRTCTDGNANDLDEFARVERAEGQRLACAESTSALAQSPNHLNALVGGTCTDGNAGSGEREPMLVGVHVERDDACTDGNAGSGERDSGPENASPRASSCTDGNAGSGERVSGRRPRRLPPSACTDGNAGSDERVARSRSFLLGNSPCTDGNAGSDERDAERCEKHRSAVRACTDGNAGSDERGNHDPKPPPQVSRPCTDGNAGSDERGSHQHQHLLLRGACTDGNAGSDERGSRVSISRTDEDAGLDERGKSVGYIERELAHAASLMERVDLIKSERDRRFPWQPFQRASWRCRRETIRAQRLSGKAARIRREALHVWSTATCARATDLTVIAPPVKAATASARGDQHEWGAAIKPVAEINRNTLNQAPALVISMLVYKAKEAGIRCDPVVDASPKLAIAGHLVKAVKTTRRLRQKIRKIAS